MNRIEPLNDSDDGVSDIVLPPHPHKMVCPVCGLSRRLPDGWQAMLSSDTLTCTTDQVAMVEVDDAE